MNDFVIVAHHDETLRQFLVDAKSAFEAAAFKFTKFGNLCEIG